MDNTDKREKMEGQPLIDEDFVKSGQLYDMMNDLADVHDREIRRKCNKGEQHG